jgi:hypothetical protein
MANEARYPIKIDSNAAQAGREGAAGLEELRKAAQSSQTALKDMQTSLRSLKGDSDEVKSAKKQLTDQIKAENAALTKVSLEAMKAGSSLDKLAAETKKFNEEAKKGNAKKLADEEKQVADASKQAEKDWAAFTSVIAIGVGILAAAAAGVGKLGGAIIGARNELRNQSIVREAFLGDAESAEHLGNQIDALIQKVPQSRAEMNDMAKELALAGVQGKALVDTLNATAQVSSLLGGSAGKQLASFVERGRLSGRFGLSPQELQGTGLKFADVAKALATSTKTSVQEASQALLQGQVTLGQGAEALRIATETKFGKLNLAKTLDLDVLKTKLSDAGAALTKDVNLEPLQAAASDLLSVADTSTVAGKGLKEITTFLGQGIVDALASSGPLLKGFLIQSEIGAFKLMTAWLDLKIALHNTFGGVLDGLDAYKIGVEAARFATAGFDSAIFIVRTNLHFITSELKLITDAFHAIESAYDSIKSLDWASVGKSITDGIVGPIKTIPDAVGGLGGNLIGGLKDSLGIHSPSTVARDEIGKQIPAGVALGIDDGRRQVDAAIGRTAGSVATGAGATTSSTSYGPVNVEVHYTAGKGDSISDVTMAVRAAVLEALEAAQRQRGFQAP